MSRTRTALRLALGAGLGALAMAQPASAATVRVDQGEDGRHLRFAAGGGEENRLRVSTAADGRIVFQDDGAPLAVSGSACLRVSAHEARCRADAAPTLAISLGDRDDDLVVDADLPAYVGGDAGNDRLTGGRGSDGFWGGEGDDVLDGRGGADLLLGEGGTDTVRYADRTAPVTVNLVYGGLGTEGEAGERDTVASDVERVVGGGGADRLTGNDGPNQLVGGGGDDTLVGGAGADDLLGGGGSDTLRSRDGAIDTVNCGGEPDAVEADPGDKVLECEATAGPAAPGSPAAGGAPAALTVPFTFTLGSVAVPAKPVALRGAHVTLAVSCPEGTPGGRCTGVITLERVVRAPKGRRATVSRRTKRRVRVGTQGYAVRAGRRSRVRVRVSRVVRRRVARTGAARVHVYLRRTKRARKGTHVGTLKVRASRRTKRRAARTS